MNAFYHSFEPGFNWWYVVAPVLFVLCVFYGSKRSRLSDEGKLMVRRNHYYRLAALAIVAGLVIGWMVVSESWYGLVQTFDNKLGKYESGIVSTIEAGIAVVCLVVFYGLACYFGGVIASKVKRWALIRKLTRIRTKAMRRRDYLDRTA